MRTFFVALMGAAALVTLASCGGDKATGAKADNTTGAKDPELLKAVEVKIRSELFGDGTYLGTRITGIETNCAAETETSFKCKTSMHVNHRPIAYCTERFFNTSGTLEKNGAFNYRTSKPTPSYVEEPC